MYFPQLGSEDDPTCVKKSIPFESTAVDGPSPSCLIIMVFFETRLFCRTITSLPFIPWLQVFRPLDIFISSFEEDMYSHGNNPFLPFEGQDFLTEILISVKL